MIQYEKILNHFNKKFRILFQNVQNILKNISNFYKTYHIALEIIKIKDYHFLRIYLEIKFKEKDLICDNVNPPRILITKNFVCNSFFLAINVIFSEFEINFLIFHYVTKAQ